MIFTDAAADRVGRLIKDEGNDNLKLRISISGGGCSGFMYNFGFVETVEDEDTEIENRGVTVVVDPMSFMYLVDAEVDFEEDIAGSRFVIRNPDTATTCGCGSSFSV